MITLFAQENFGVFFSSMVRYFPLIFIAVIQKVVLFTTSKLKSLS